MPFNIFILLWLPLGEVVFESLGRAFVTWRMISFRRQIIQISQFFRILFRQTDIGFTHKLLHILIFQQASFGSNRLISAFRLLRFKRRSAQFPIFPILMNDPHKQKVFRVFMFVRLRVGWFGRIGDPSFGKAYIFDRESLNLMHIYYFIATYYILKAGLDGEARKSKKNNAESCGLGQPVFIRELMQVNYIIFQMDEQFQNELETTKASFYKLQDNFNHNLLVIKELEEDNEQLLEQNQNLKHHYHKEIDELYSSIEGLKRQNKKLASMINSQVEKARALCEEETQHLVQMMNEKMLEEKRYQGQKYARQKKQAQAEIQKYEESLKYYTVENSKLVEAVKQLRIEKQQLQSQLQGMISQKQTYANKFSLHQKQLENLRNANEQWETILKQKVKEANKEKQKIEQQLSETKLAFKLKLKSVKDQAAKKIEELQTNKQKNIRLVVQEAKEIKLRFDTAVQQLQKLRAEAKQNEKQRTKMEEKIQELSKQAGSEKQIQYLKRMFQQQKIQLKSDNKMMQSQKNQMKEELKQVNQRRQEVQKTVQRLKTALMAAQKEVTEGERKYKKLQKQIKQLRAEAKKIAETTNMNFRGYQNFDVVNENPPQQNLDYSKYFSEDMGPGDQMFFMENSMPKSPKSIKAQNGPSPVNHQLMKKIGELQVQVDQYKNTIKTMSEQMQRIKSIYLDQVSMKDQQIKLGRDEVHLLREKINERQQQLLVLASLRQQIEDKNRKITDLSEKTNTLLAQSSQKNNKIQKLDALLAQTKQKLEETQSQLKNCQEEKKILDQINEDLRAEIHQYKNRIRLYNQSEEEQSLKADEQEFQEMKFDQSSSQDVLKKSEEFNRKRNSKSKSKSRSRSKSGKKTGVVHKGNLLQGNKATMKLKDLVLRKKQLQMAGKKMNIQYKQPSSNKEILKTGTQSQKQILQNYKRQSKQKEREKAEKFRGLDYERLIRQGEHAEND